MKDVILKVSVSLSNVVRESMNELKADLKKPTSLMSLAMFALVAFAVMGMIDPMYAADPIATIRNVTINQAQSNAFPMMILYVIAFGAILAFVMQKLYIFILALFVAVVIGISPNLIDSFNPTDLNATS